ncbi:MAG: condensation domain-containing protein, partial [Chloroflexota bacterium]
MKVIPFLSQLNDLGILLRVEEDRLVCDAPKGALTAEIGAQIREHKGELITFLTQADSLNMTALPALQPVSRNGSCPLSFAQERLWQLTQFDPDASTYNIPAVLRLRGSLDSAALQSSLT